MFLLSSVLLAKFSAWNFNVFPLPDDCFWRLWNSLQPAILEIDAVFQVANGAMHEAAPAADTGNASFSAQQLGSVELR